MSDNSEAILTRIREHAYVSLSARAKQGTNLYLDSRVYKKGETIGPKFQQIAAPNDSLLVFADDYPQANFGHNCRYLLYDPANGRQHAEIPARFPPFTTKPSGTLKVFHEPIPIRPSPTIFNIPPILRCPIFNPDGNRYAILYSGMSNLRHLNDLEFCYRMLVDRYGFNKNNIYVLNYDGTVNSWDIAPTVWPGDGTAYRIKVTGQGTRAAFQAAFNDLKTKLKSHDLLFIHTNNHGDNSGGQSFLCQYPDWSNYWANDFANDLGGLPKYRSLIVMMEQCDSGGFNAPVLAKSTAADSSIASAALAGQLSWGSPDGHWDSFARDWIAAQIGHDPYGAALAFNPDTDHDGVIEAEEAFNYALAVQNASDSPNYGETSEAGGDITLGQKYILWWWWCWIILPVLEKYAPVPPDPEFYSKVQGVLPDLQKLVTPVFDNAAASVRREIAPQVEAAVKAAFGQSK